MDQFTHLPEFQVIVCRKCKHAVLPSQIDTHFTKKPDHALDKPSRQQIFDAVFRIPNLISNEDILRERGFQYPPATAAQIPELSSPKTNGNRCKFETREGIQCPYISCQRQGIQEHCRLVHQWENPKRKGRPTLDQRRQVIPWETGVHCQRFFTHGPYSGFFEVQREVIGVRAEEPWEKASRIIAVQIARAEERQNHFVEVTDEAQEANPWLRRTGWARHLEDFNKEELRELVAEIDEESEPILSNIQKGFRRVIKRAQQTATSEVVGLFALFRINGVEYQKKGTNPFPAYMDDNTESKYSAVWEKLLRFIIRAEKDWGEGDRPEYIFTHGQKKAFNTLFTKAEEYTNVDRSEQTSDESQAETQELDNCVLEFCIELLDHQLVGNEYESAIISGLAVLGVREDMGWIDAIDYTPMYSGIIKLARLMVIQHAHQEWEKSIAMAIGNGCSKEQAKESCQTHFQLIRAKVDRFMGLEGGRRDPSPMDWIWSTRSYGMKIRYTTTAEGKVGWDGETILYGKTEYSMTQLRNTVHGLVSQARTGLMKDLMLVEMNIQDEINEGQVPRIHWGKLRDNPVESQVGWSFLQDPRNKFEVDGLWWL